MLSSRANRWLLAAAIAASGAWPAQVHGYMSAQEPRPVGAGGPLVKWTVPYSNPPICPREEEVRGWISESFPSPDVGADVVVDLFVSRLGGGWKLVLTMKGPLGTHERTFVTARCERVVIEAVDELTKVILLGGPGEVETAPPLTNTPATTTDTSPTGEAERSRWGLLQVVSGVTLGIVRPTMALLRLSAGYRAKRWSLSMTQTFLLPRDVPSGTTPRINASVWLWAAGVRGCWISLKKRLEVGVCGTLEAGTMTGRSDGEDRERQIRPWVALSAGPGASVLLGERVRLKLGIDLTMVLARPLFTFRDKLDTCCDERFGGRVFGGLEFRLP